MMRPMVIINNNKKKERSEIFSSICFRCLGSDEGLEDALYDPDPQNLDEPSLVEPSSSLPSVEEPSVAQPSPPVSPSVASQQPATGREEQDEHTSASPVALQNLRPWCVNSMRACCLGLGAWFHSGPMTSLRWMLAIRSGTH